MKNISILAAGPPKPGRQRHLELLRGTPLINEIIDKCTIADCKVHIVINSANLPLIEHIKKIPSVEILFPKDETIYSTFESALSPEGDCIMVCGDLINLQEGDVQRFVDSPLSSAICRYGQAWGQHLVSSQGSVRRADMGDCICLVSEKDKEELLGDENYNKALGYFKEFYPNQPVNFESYNDIGTHLNYSFFKEVWGNPNVDSAGTRGTLYFEHVVYADND
tara:strand:+ start:1024 stop:1689 length:666 start_codon:yes stop_codon:yes gene_type:complete